MDYEDISAINGYHEAFVDDDLVRVNVFSVFLWNINV